MFAHVGKCLLNNAQQLERNQRGQFAGHVFALDIDRDTMAVFVRIDVLTHRRG